MVLFYAVAHSGCAVLKTGRRRGTCTPPSWRSCWQVLPSENLGRDFVLPGPRCRKKEKLPVPRVTKISTVHLFISNLTRAVWGLSRFTVNTLLRDFQSQNGVTGHPGGVRQHRAGHHNLAHCSLLEATGCHASSCSMHHHASASCIMSHAGNPRIFACVYIVEIYLCTFRTDFTTHRLRLHSTVPDPRKIYAPADFTM